MAAASARLAASCALAAATSARRAASSERVAASVAGMLDKADEALWKLAELSTERTLRDRYLRAKDKLRAERHVLEEQFREVGAILACDPGDDRASTHECPSFYVVSAPRVASQRRSASCHVGIVKPVAVSLSIDSAQNRGRWALNFIWSMVTGTRVGCG